MTPTRLAAGVFAALAVAAPFVASWLVVPAALAVAAAVVVDALLVRDAPPVSREVPAALVRGAPTRLLLRLAGRVQGRARLRQPVGPDLRLFPGEAEAALEAELVGVRRGSHPLPRAVVRVRGPLGLGAWTHRACEEAVVRVYPDLPGARRLAASLRTGRFREEGRRTRGPIGLGTDFETLRDYSPDDDVRQVNWLATARLGRPISNQFRLERDRDVICLVDCGRLTAAPVGDATRLDIAIDAAVAVAAAAEELGDRCGALAFDAQLRRSVPPRRRGARDVVEALFDLEPVPVDSDYERAFHELTRAKRAFALVLTDLIEPTAAQPLVDALPVLARHHAVAVASVADPDLTMMAAAPRPRVAQDVYRAAVALDVLAARNAAVAELRHAGGDVVEAEPARLAAACVSAYLRAKARARL
jgi:uncharacterized protein (DUF58 family)